MRRDLSEISSSQKCVQIFLIEQVTFFSARFAHRTFCLFATDPLTRWNSHKHSFEMWRRKMKLLIISWPLWEHNATTLIEKRNKHEPLLRYVRSDSLANIFMSECPPKWWLIHAGLKRKLCVKFRFVIEEVIHRSRITSHQINGMARKKAALRRLFISAFVSQPKNLALLLMFGIS